MKIVVCLKQVPDTTAVKIDPKTGTLIRDGVPSIINPEDKHALEAALQLKDNNGAEVTVLSMGPPQAKSALREALCMGADKAILITDRAFAGADTWATSSALAGALKNIDFDIIIAGRQAIDGDTAQVGPQIAEHLNLPSITYAEEIKTEGEYVLVKRQFEDCCHDLKVKMPCLITTLKDMNTPRYMKVGRIYDAFENDVVETWTVKDIEVDPSNLGLKGSPTSVFKSFTKSVK
ncbi:MAG: electron transfer flavoprotein subunit beta/FixA family protein, partial [Clostridium perfringens]|nr:electron transfer flavoprotein subunit beta/FixA family protein [Clostridium perfringens]